MTSGGDTPGKNWPLVSPAAEFEAWLAANPVELPDTRKHQLRPRPNAKPLTVRAARRRLLAVAVGFALTFVVAVVAVTWLITLMSRARVIP